MSADPSDYSKYLVPTRAPSSPASKPDYAQMAREEAAKLKLPEKVVLNLFGLESGYNPNARSYKGAKGIGQMMPDTDRYIRNKYGIDTSTPRGQIQGSLHYLKEQYDEFGNDELAVAAYHAGPGAIRKSGGRIPNTSDGLTRTPDYVKKIVGTNDLALKPTRVPSRPSANGYEKYLVHEGKVPEASGYEKYLVDSSGEAVAPPVTASPSTNVLPFIPSRTPSTPAQMHDEGSSAVSSALPPTGATSPIDTKVDPAMSATAKRAAESSAPSNPVVPTKPLTLDELNNRKKQLKVDAAIANMPDSGVLAQDRYQKNFTDLNSKIEAYNQSLGNNRKSEMQPMRVTSGYTPGMPLANNQQIDEQVNINAGDGDVSEDDIYRGWYDAVKAGDFNVASMAARIYGERFPSGKYARHVYDPISGTETVPLSEQKQAREGAVAVNLSGLENLHGEELRQEAQRRFKSGLGFDDATYEAFVQQYGFDPASLAGYGTGREQIKQTPEEFEASIRQMAGADNTALIRVPKATAEKVQEFFNDKSLSDPSKAQAVATMQGVKGRTGLNELLQDVPLPAEGNALLAGADMLPDSVQGQLQQGAAGTAQGMLGTAASLAKGAGVLIREGAQLIGGDNTNTPISNLLIGLGNRANNFLKRASFENTSGEGLNTFSLGQGFGSAATFAASGGASKTASAILGAFSEAGSAYDETYERLINQGYSPERAHKAAVNAAILNIPAGLSEGLLGAGATFERALEEGVAGAGWYRNFIGALAKAGTEEGLQERTQTRMENMVAQVAGDRKRPLSQGEAQGALIGLITGGVMQGATNLAVHSAESDASLGHDITEININQRDSFLPGEEEEPPSRFQQGVAKLTERGLQKIADARRSTVPEKPQTIAEQLNALEQGQRQAVLITKGETLPVIPSGYFTTRTKEGTFIHKRDVKSKDVRKMVQDGTFGELLGHVAPKPVNGAPSATVAARDEQGNELQTSVVPPEMAEQQAQALQAQFPNASIEVGGEETAQNIIDERLSKSAGESNPAKETTTAPHKGAARPIQANDSGQTENSKSFSPPTDGKAQSSNYFSDFKKGDTVTHPNLAGGKPLEIVGVSNNGRNLDIKRKDGKGRVMQLQVDSPQGKGLQRVASSESGTKKVDKKQAEKPATTLPVENDFVAYQKLNPEAKKTDFANRMNNHSNGSELQGIVYMDARYTPHFSPFPTNAAASNWIKQKNNFTEMEGEEGTKLMSLLAANKLTPRPGQSVNLGDLPKTAKVEIDSAAHEAATSPKNDLPAPTEGQIEAGNYKKGHARISGLDISIENPIGSKRRPEWPTMKSHYGYIKQTAGADSEHIDVFVKAGTPEDYAGPVYVVDQENKDGSFDEHKVMLGYDNEGAARTGYAENYTKDWKVGPIQEFKSVDDFREWLNTGDTTKPATVKTEKYQQDTKPDIRNDDLYNRVVEFLDAGNQATPSSLQRKFGIGYGENQRVIERLKKEGLIDAKGYKPIESTKAEESDDDFLQRLKNRVGSANPKAKSSQVEKPSESPVDADTEFMRQLKERVANKQQTKVAEKRTEISKGIVEADDEISSLLGKLKDAGKKQHSGPTSDEELLLMVKLVRAYVKKGIHSFRLAVLNFQEHFAEHGDPRRYDDYLHEAWAMLCESNPELDEARPVGEILSEEEAQGDDSFDFGEEQEEVKEEQKVEPIVEPQKQHSSAIGEYVPKISEDIAGRLLAGEKFNIVAARKIASEIMGSNVAPGTQLAKDVDEAIEAGVVQAARKIVDEGLDEKATFEKLVDLYKRQPNLNVRTSTSIAQQAYSTPVPIAYLASKLANIDDSTIVYEPTAGNAALLIGANPENVYANELNPNRANVLRQQLPGAQVTEQDATEFLPDRDVDSVIANPPFGAVKDDDGNSKKFKINSRYTTTEIDHAIALKALSAMKDDGNAVLILGGVQAVDPKARSDAYNGKSKRAFFYTLYHEYNVVDHLTIDGDLYSRQGAAFPIDLIVIKGRSESSRKLPAVDVPRIYDSFESLGELLNVNQNSVLDANVSRDSNQSKSDGSTNRRSSRSRKGAGDGQSDLPLFAFGQDSVSDRESGESGIDAGQSVPGPERSKSVQPANAGTERGSKPTDLQQLPVERAPVSDGLVPESSQSSGKQQPDGGKNVSSDGSGAVDKRAPRTSSRVNVKEGQSQIAYEPASKANSLNTLVPVNMVSSTQNALNRISNKVGDIDSFVAEKLGYKPEDIPDYFSAEQVDALALALDNMERGKGFIIGDQTGIGKGRVVAGVIRYAIRTGRTPIFVTEKPNLYKDIYRDMVDIGLKDVRPLMTNANERVPLDDEGNKVLRTSEGHNKELERLINLGKLDKYDVVFTTYSQLQTVQGKSTPRQDFVKAFANGGIIIFDESHNAGGAEVVQRGKTEGEKQGRALLARQIAGVADGVFYSSATYAKRPQVMDLYFKTDMSLAVPIRQLAETIQKGGVPLQQVVASMLSEAGQYIRRERSFEGVEYSTRPAPVNKQLAESVSKVMRHIQQFDDLKQSALAAIKEQVKEDAKATLQDTSVGKAGVTSTNFTSLMHNLIDQMLLSLKMDSTIETAIESLKNGEKPVITVANTMGSFIASYAEENGLKPGDAMGLNFGDMLRRYLERSREILIGDAFGKKTRHYLTDAELGDYGVTAYDRTIKAIENIDWSKMPASPIDYVKHKLEMAGYRVGEITGRQHTLSYSNSKAPVYRMRPGSEIKIAGRNRTIQQFNNGQMDALILNQAGSTGLSLHASSKFRDKRVRHMIIAQAERNIDTHMQMLGRVHRTGQVVVPRYSQLVADVPAEMRPASVLAKKMASLNANTTASRGSALTAKDVPDFMNEYGDEVAAQLLEDDPDLYRMLGRPIKFAERGLEREDAMRKVTGRIPLLSIAEQERVYDLLTSEYDSFLQRLESTGENALEAKTLPLDAKTISKKEISAPKGSDSPFSAGAYLETMDVKKLGRPLSGEEVVKLVATNLDSVATDLDVLKKEGNKKYFDLENQTRKRFNEYKASVIDDEGEEAKRRAQESRLDGLFERWQEVIGQATVGETVKLHTLGGEVYGVVTGVEQKGNPKNPVALGSWRVNIAVADASRKITVPISQLLTVEQAHNVSAIGRSIVMEPVREVNDLINGRMPVLDLFDQGQAETREKRNIITGNLLAGFGQFPKGAIINFTDSTGEVKQGILMPRSFDLDKEMADRPVQFETVKQVLSFLNEATGKQGIITSEDEVLRIQIDRNGDYFITTPSSKAQGGRYFLNRALLDAAGQDFVKAGNTMRVMLDQAHAEKFIKELFEQEIPLVASSFKNEAKQVITTHKNVNAEIVPLEISDNDNRVFAAVEATLRTKGKESRLYLNNSAAEILSAMIRLKDGHTVAGATITNIQAKAIADMLTQFAVRSTDQHAQDALISFADAMEDAANARGGVVIINRDTGGPQRIITTIRHEEGHYTMQKLRATQQKAFDTTGVVNHPKYASAKKKLDDLGYIGNTEDMVEEIAVRIIGNQLDSIGLDKQSAYELLDLFFDMVENAYGDKAVKEFRHIAPSFKRLRDERAQRTTQTLTTGTSDDTRISGQGTERRESNEELREAGDSPRQGGRRISEGVLQNQGIDDKPPRLEIKQKLRQAIDDAYKEEKRKNEAGFFRIRSENNQQSANPYAFENEERESRFQDAKKGIQKESRLDQFKAWLTDFARSASRDLEHLPRGAEHAELSNALRRLAKGKAIASDEAIRYIQSVTVGLSEEQSDLFVKKVILDDLVEEASRQEAREVEDIKLPFGFTPDELVNEYARISNFVDADEKVKAAVEHRLELMKEITKEYYAASEAIGIKPDLSREHYYHHQVLEYAQAEHSKLKGTGGKLRAPTGRDFLKQRQGSELDINANYLQAEHHVIAQMLFDTQILKVFKLIQDNHDITPQLKSEAKAANEAALQQIIQSEQRALEPAERKKKAQTLWQFIRSKGGIKLTEDTVESGELRRLSRKEMGTSGLVSPNAKLTADYMREAAAEAGFIDGDMSLGDFLSFVEDSGRDAIAMENKDAAADVDVDAMLEEEMPENELRAKRAAEAFDKLVARHGLTEATLIRFRQKKGWAFSQLRQLANQNALWTGENGEWAKAVSNLLSHRNYGAPMSEDGQMFKYLSALAQSDAEGSLYARTIMKAVAQQRQFIQQRLGKEYKTYEDLIPDTHKMLPPREGNVFYKAFSLSEQQVNAAITHALDTLEVPTEKIKEIMAWGGKRKGPIVPVEVADQIDNFMTPKTHGKFSRGMRKVVGWWKIWQLISPTRVVKYNTRNVSGDLDPVIAGNPSALKKLKPAAVELTDFLFRKKSASKNLEKWMQAGGLQGLYGVAEDPTAINGLNVFRNMSPDKEGRLQKLNLWRQYWRAARMGSDARESLLRYATFLDYLEQIDKYGKPKNYGASIRSEIDAMLKGKHSTNEDVAYKLSNDLLGAYDEVSQLGQDIRETYAPFWSWQEVNFKRYKRLFQNAIADDQLASTVGRKMASMAVRSPVIAMRMGRFGLKAMALTAMLSAFNHAFFDDEEEDLPAEVRKRPHIILGRNPNGSVRYFSRLGAVSDLFEWFGVDGDLQFARDYLNGRKTLGEIASEMAMAVPSKLWNSQGPGKTVFEEVSGYNTYPNPFNARKIRDRWEFGYDSLGLGDVYRQVKGMPTRGTGQTIANLFIYQSDPGEVAYNDIQSAARKWKEKNGLESEGGGTANAKSNAAFYFKQALKYGDKRAADKYLREYIMNGGTGKGLKAVLENLNPLSSIPEKLRPAFLASLSADDRKDLNQAIQYYYRILAPDATPAQPGQAQEQKEQPAPAKQQSSNLQPTRPIQKLLPDNASYIRRVPSQM